MTFSGLTATIVHFQCFILFNIIYNTSLPLRIRGALSISTPFLNRSTSGLKMRLAQTLNTTFRYSNYIQKRLSDTNVLILWKTFVQSISQKIPFLIHTLDSGRTFLASQFGSASKWKYLVHTYYWFYKMHQKMQEHLVLLSCDNDISLRYVCIQ